MNFLCLKSRQQEAKSAQQIMGCSLPHISDLQTTKKMQGSVAGIVRESTYPVHELFASLLSCRRQSRILARTTRWTNCSKSRDETSVGFIFLQLIRFLKLRSHIPTCCGSYCYNLMRLILDSSVYSQWTLKKPMRTKEDVKSHAACCI